MTEVYECEYCGQQFQILATAENHEQSCEYNDDCKHDEREDRPGDCGTAGTTAPPLDDEAGGDWAVVKAPERRERRDSDERSPTKTSTAKQRVKAVTTTACRSDGYSDPEWVDTEQFEAESEFYASKAQSGGGAWGNKAYGFQAARRRYYASEKRAAQKAGVQAAKGWRYT